MARLYINGDEARITPHDAFTVDVELYDGTVFTELEPRRLFPVSGLRRYVSLVDADGKERAIIRDLDQLMPESREVVDTCLDQYYLVPRIVRILDFLDKRGILKCKVETDRGVRSFEIVNRHHDIKLLYDNRMLIRDSHDNRYEIPDVTQLDKSSLYFLREFL